jgi:histidine triad (HIT) family protein
LRRTRGGKASRGTRAPRYHQVFAATGFVASVAFVGREEGRGETGERDQADHNPRGVWQYAGIMTASASEATCLFCKIVRKEIPAKILFEDEETVAFHDIAGKAPVHVLVIPKAHHASILEVPTSLGAALFGSIQRVARESGVAESGFRTVANTGQDGGQSVGHLHFHVLGGRPLGWPPG